MSDRKDILLKAAYDLLKDIEDSCYSDGLTITIYYDDADCDGYCLMEDIANEIEIE